MSHSEWEGVRDTGQLPTVAGCAGGREMEGTLAAVSGRQDQLSADFSCSESEEQENLTAGGALASYQDKICQ
jgi:hypothetical protein